MKVFILNQMMKVFSLNAMMEIFQDIILIMMLKIIKNVIQVAKHVKEKEMIQIIIVYYVQMKIIMYYLFQKQ